MKSSASLERRIKDNLINLKRRFGAKFMALIAKQVQTDIATAVAESEEPVYDSVPLAEAEFTKGEKYILVRCTPEQFKQLETTGRPVKLGYFTKEGWSGGLPFYLFKCPTCKTVSVDYKHGLHPYLFCEDCKTSVTFRYFLPASKKYLA